MESASASAPVSLTQALTTFDETWSPRIVTSVNDYDVRLAKAEGEHVWHVHEDTDEFFLVVEGELTIGLREKDGEQAVVLPAARSSPSPAAPGTSRTRPPAPRSSSWNPPAPPRRATPTTPYRTTSTRRRDTTWG